jgi:hypothetical protein
MFFPDYNGIEIKCKQRYSRYAIDLFTLSFDGPSLFESNYVLEKYGKVDKVFLDKKSLFINLVYNQKVLVNSQYFFKLEIDDKNKMLLVSIYDINEKLLEKRCFIDFSSIKSRLIVKLSKLALVRASKRKIGFDLYFRYYKISCYYLKSFDNFIEMIKNGTVLLSIVFRFSRSGIKKGKQRNKNMVFSIRQDDVEEIFTKIYEYEN